MKYASALIVLAAGTLWSGTASAQTDEPLGEYGVTPGAECTIHTQNNVSVHPGNVLFVVGAVAGSEPLRIDNVEDEAFTQRTVAFTAPDVDSISAYVRINPDQPDPVTSLAMQVICEKPPPDTTTTTTTTPPPPPPPPPPPTCVELGTCHPDTGGSESTGTLFGLAGVLAAAGVALGVRRVMV